MPRDKKIKVCAVNIAMQNPHSIKRYVDLFVTAYELHKVISARGTTGITMGFLSAIQDGDFKKGMWGDIYRFIDLDSSLPWFDTVKRKQASEDARDEISIPENLKPHLHRFRFVFFPNGHRLYLSMRSNDGNAMSPGILEAYLKDLFLLPEFDNFGHIEVTVEPEKDTIRKILRIRQLRILTIDLQRPNPDDHKEKERKVLERLESQRARKMHVVLTAEKKGHLDPDEDIKTIAEVAASNGYVIGEGRDINGDPVRISTREIPLVNSYTYNPNVQSEMQALQAAADQMHTDLTS